MNCLQKWKKVYQMFSLKTRAEGAYGVIKNALILLMESISAL